MSANTITQAADRVCKSLRGRKFSHPVTHVYNPLEYARASHQVFINRFGDSKKRVLFMGMNPGPWGMAQTGVPFGEVDAVRNWMGICEAVSKPKKQHPKRLVTGFDCEKSEVSGRRLWGYFSELYPGADEFFADHYVVNYCPLVWMEESGRNRTPDKIPAAEMEKVYQACDRYVLSHLEALEPEYAIGVGAFAEKRLKMICKSAGLNPLIGKILHPSPASPLANKDWAGTAEKQLKQLGVF